MAERVPPNTRPVAPGKCPLEVVVRFIRRNRRGMRPCLPAVRQTWGKTKKVPAARVLREPGLKRLGEESRHRHPPSRGHAINSLLLANEDRSGCLVHVVDEH